ncbi:hypothetical protein [Paraburkholderia dilworthii]|nr:hypothetical protein [Paraburkholderia dilworthii]
METGFALGPSIAALIDWAEMKRQRTVPTPADCG